MTLEEAIEHALDKGLSGGKCGAEHRQLAHWLGELQERRKTSPLPNPPAMTPESQRFWRRVHNLVAHPLMEVLPEEWGTWAHDLTARLAFGAEEQ